MKWKNWHSYFAKEFRKTHFGNFLDLISKNFVQYCHQTKLSFIFGKISESMKVNSFVKLISASSQQLNQPQLAE